MMKMATPEEAVALTSVFWDINKCPVPAGFDPCRVRPCIKQFLENYGYVGPLTITAVGVLAYVPTDILRGVYSSGIALTNVPDGCVDMLDHIYSFSQMNPPPATIIALSDPNLSISTFIHMMGYNYFQPLFSDLLTSDSGAPEVETVESAYWDCLVCRRDPPGQGFVNFTKHLSSEEHQQLMLTWLPGNNPPSCLPFAPLDSHPANVTVMPLHQEEAVTSVFWDINKCPVPLDFDPRLVGPCIKRFLEKAEYPGPITIIAVGLLIDVPVDVLRAVSSTGIVLHNVPYGSVDLINVVTEFTITKQPPANIIVISEPASKLHYYLQSLGEWGYTILFHTSLQSITTLAGSGPLEEDKCSETGESACWICSVCCRGHAFLGFDNLITHLSSRSHQRKKLDWLPSNARFSHRVNASFHGDEA